MSLVKCRKAGFWKVPPSESWAMQSSEQHSTALSVYSSLKYAGIRDPDIVDLGGRLGVLRRLLSAPVSESSDLSLVRRGP